MTKLTRFAPVIVAAMLAAPMAAFANQAVHLDGDLTIVHDTPSVKTRAEVKQELQAFRAKPVAADGFRWVGGELGWVSPNSIIAKGRV